MENGFKPIDSEEVVSVQVPDKLFMDYPMFKVGQLVSKIQFMVQGFGAYDAQKTKNWFSEGIDCEIFQLGAKGWKKGKVRIRLSVEFLSDEPEPSQFESPLDDIRKKINENS